MHLLSSHVLVLGCQFCLFLFFPPFIYPNAFWVWYILIRVWLKTKYIWLVKYVCVCTALTMATLYSFFNMFNNYSGARVAQWVRSFDLTTHTSQITNKGAFDSQSQVIQFTMCLPRVGGSLRVLRLPLPLKLVATI